MAGSEKATCPFGLTRGPGAFQPLDAVTVAYAAFSALVLTVGAAQGLKGCRERALANLAIVVLVPLFCRWTRRTKSRLLLFLRLAYVPSLFYHFFSQVEVIWPIFQAHVFDHHLVAAEQWLFGFQPSLEFQKAVYNLTAVETWSSGTQPPPGSPQPVLWRLVGEVFCLAYFLYYCYTLILGVAFLARRGYAAAERMIFAAAICFFTCFTFFWFYPVAAPQFWFPPYEGPLLYPGYAANHVLFFFTSRGEIYAGAFPSSHIAVAVLLTIYCRREARWLFPYLLACTGLICGAVVFLRAHYFVDIPPGILVGVLFSRLADPCRAGLARRMKVALPEEAPPDNGSGAS